MATFKLDDREIPYQEGQTVIEAARQAGIDIPHYCWHPGLSVAANCRMCLVEILPPPGRPALMLDVLAWDANKQQYVPQKKPKLAPACQQKVTPGLEVKSQSSEHVTTARAAVQELLLLNHPVDCPICDQAGECRLQDYWLEHGATKKRMSDEPVHKPKAQVFSKTIVYDAERCIVCTRCIRVSEELAKDPVLSLRERGNLNEVVLAPGRELDHPYSLMTEYVCPVGALTATDFRFKARVWFLRSARSVCVGCATGCNSFTDYDPRSQTVYRYRPRENLAVNKYWMCDEGMLDYRRIHEGRVLEARVAGSDVAGARALRRALELLQSTPSDRVLLVLSAQHSSEDNLALLRLGVALGIQSVYVGGRAQGPGDDILRHKDKNPNSAGVRALLAGRAPERLLGSVDALVNALSTDRLEGVLALGSELGSEEALAAVRRAKWRIAIATHDGPLAAGADVVLPAASWAESSGTFVNALGHAQVSEAAITPRGASSPAWLLVAELAKALGTTAGFGRLSDARRALVALSGANAPERSGRGSTEAVAEAGAGG